MKCEYCGGLLQIEDAKCPHCGKDNPHYIKHRSDMQAYQADYQSTKEEVLQNTSKLNRRNVHITVIAVLVALCAVAAVFCILGDNIQDARRESGIERNKTVYETHIRGYMEEGDPIGLYQYANRNRLTYSKALEEYDKVFTISMYYNYFYEYTMELMTEGTEKKYYTLEERCQDISRYAGYLYQYRERQSYDKEACFTPDKVAFMDETVGKLELFLKAYFGLSDEEIAQVPSLSQARLTLLLAEGYDNEH